MARQLRKKTVSSPEEAASGRKAFIRPECGTELRSMASYGAENLCSVPCNGAVDVLEDGEWALVQFGHLKGYVRNETLKE